MIAFAASAILAAVAGILLGAMRPMTKTMGAEPLVKALIVAIFGGLGSIGGTIGAHVIGLIEAISTYWVGLYWTPTVLFAVMIAVLLWRPSGLFGGG
jgi:branched-chain amino acid transport system permease protein